MERERQGGLWLVDREVDLPVPVRRVETHFADVRHDADHLQRGLELRQPQLPSHGRVAAEHLARQGLVDDGNRRPGRGVAVV